MIATDAPRIKPSAFRRVVKASAVNLGVRNTALQILNVLLDNMHFATGFSWAARSSLMEQLGRSEKCIKYSLKQLRDVGIINIEKKHGRGLSPLYRFGVTQWAVNNHNAKCKKGEEFSPLWPVCFVEKGGKNFPKRGKKFPEKGVKITPPTSDFNHSSENEDAAGRGEVDKASSSGPSAGADALTPISIFDAMTLLSGQGVNASYSEVAGGLFDRELAALGQVVCTRVGRAWSGGV